MKQWRGRRLLVLGASLTLVLTSLEMGNLTTASAAAAATVFYLDVGASVSVGVQPTAAVPKGQPTNRGYGERLVALEAARGVTLLLTKIGCPGESLTTMIKGGDACYQKPDTQLSDAVAFLHAHRTEHGLVSVDLGFNTINPCLRTNDVDMACVNPEILALDRQLPQILRTLQSAAGPHVTFVGLGHYNPYLAASTNEGAHEVFAHDSVAAIRMLNQSLRAIYASFHIAVAGVAKAFFEEQNHLVYSPGSEPEPLNVLWACAYTWMCQAKPYGPNLHPNDAGYQAITQAIAAALPATL